MNYFFNKSAIDDLHRRKWLIFGVGLLVKVKLFWAEGVLKSCFGGRFVTLFYGDN